MRPFTTLLADCNDTHQHTWEIWPWLGAGTNLWRRKVWEYLYVYKQYQAWAQGRQGLRALGFGSGLDRMAMLLSCQQQIQESWITDGPAASCWVSTGQHVQGLEQYLQANQGFECQQQKLHYKYLDMNKFGPGEAEADFMYSLSSLEHLGSMDQSLEFILRSSHQLRPGGMAVHCTEYNVGSNDRTVLRGDSVFFRHQDLLRLQRLCAEQGLEMSPLDLQVRYHPFNGYKDSPPYTYNPSHMRIQFDEWELTSFGFCIRKTYEKA